MRSTSMNQTILKQEEGFVLVVALMTMVLLTILGIAATRTAITELNISGNEKVSKQTFYTADGATEIGVELAEQNFQCPTGFESTTAGFANNDPSNSFNIRGVDVFDSMLGYAEALGDVVHNASAKTAGVIDLNKVPSPNARTLRVASNQANRDSVPVTNIALWGPTEPDYGSEQPGFGGYDKDPLGKIINLQVHAQHLGQANSVSVVRLNWLYKIPKNASDCRY